MDTNTMQFIDYTYWHYLKHLLISPPAKEHLTDNEQAMLNDIITLDECFLLEKLSHA